jgi:glycosyltransferase involved in cell wall biosynthesis
MLKKKILYVITKSNYGGAQRYVYELATRLPKETFEVVVAFGGSGILKEKLETAGIKTETIKSFERDINIFKECISLFELYRLIRKIKPDIVHLNSSKAGGTGALAARLLGVPHIIFTAHGWAFLEKRNFVWKSLVWFLSWITALLVHTVIVVSHYDYVHTRMPFIKKKVTLVHTAVPSISFKSREEARAILFPELIRTQHTTALWLVSTSEHTHNKNLFSVIDALVIHNAIQTQKIFLTLMSDGELRKDLERYAQSHAVHDTVFFTGYVDDARSYLKAFDIFVLPSLKEGLPYGLLEAGAAGLACIASRVGGIPEIIENAKTGFLTNPLQPETLTQALRSYTENPNLRDAHGRELQKHIAHTFTQKTLFEQTCALYTR